MADEKDFASVTAYVQGALFCECGKHSDALIPYLLQGNLKTWDVEVQEVDHDFRCSACGREYGAWESRIDAVDRHSYVLGATKVAARPASQILNDLARKRGIAEPKFVDPDPDDDLWPEKQ